ncbi:MAG: non-canonical purine NTP pyrophosphatase [Dehalococcoidia bacterium]|nr:non-canonical purine NTP pyrophosphatase [Dehalococcoidia bacterium]
MFGERSVGQRINMAGQPAPLGATPILLGTGNPAKQQTLQWLLEGLPLSPVTPGRLGLRTVPRERGDTHEAIARAKARDWSRAASALAIASDGGLLLPALGTRWDSRHTHRFAGPEADDAHRLRRLLNLMRPYQGPQREASWIEAVAIADRGKVLASWELRGATGVIADGPGDTARATGFWAFSVWYFPQFGKTYNQLSPEELEALQDHWARLRVLVRHFFRGYATADGG